MKGVKWVKIETFSQFQTHLKNEQPKNVYLIRGDNAYYTKKAFEMLKSKILGKSENEFTYCNFDGKNTTVDEISLACEMFPLMGECKYVCVTDLPFNELGETDFNSLCSLIEDIPEFSTLVFYAISDNLDEKMKKAEDKKDENTPKTEENKPKVKKICDLISKIGVDLNFTTKNSKNNASEFASAIAKQKGAKLSSFNAKLIAEKACYDFAIIETELEKLSNFKNGEEITEKDINDVFSLYLNTTIFELNKFVIANNLEASLQKLSEMKQQKEEPVSILGGLATAFIDLYRAQLAREGNVSVKEVMSDFAYKPNLAFRVENAFRDSQRLNKEFIKTAIKMISDTDVSLKTNGSDGFWLLEKLIIDIFVARERMVN